VLDFVQPLAAGGQLIGFGREAGRNEPRIAKDYSRASQSFWIGRLMPSDDIASDPLGYYRGVPLDVFSFGLAPARPGLSFIPCASAGPN
jgi:hypothetical protein